jgi:hypothetical protein
MTPDKWILLGVLVNLTSTGVILYCLHRNYTITKENLSLAEKIGRAMELMKELRDMLGEDLRDPFSPGNVREKEVRH